MRINSSDIAIIEGCRKNKAAAQKALFEKYGKLLFSTCLRYVANQSDAQDALQESYIRIFKYFKNFDSQKGSLKNWMIRICINESLKRLDKKKEFSDLENLPDEPYERPVALSQLQMSDLLLEIQGIPVPYRTVFNLYLIEGYSHSEIAQLLNIKASSSRSILTRAKELLRKKLQHKKKYESWI